VLSNCRGAKPDCGKSPSFAFQPWWTLRESLRPYLYKPFAFFDHSMGAPISFELAREFRRTPSRCFRTRAWKLSGASFAKPLRAASPSRRPISWRGSTSGSISNQPPRPSVAPRNETEQTIAGIWQELLGIEPIGIYDNFFELGGQPLLATQVVTRIRAALQTNLPLRRFFEAPTVSELALAVGSNSPQTAKQTVMVSESKAEPLVV
jgi:hypothetical protein